MRTAQLPWRRPGQQCSAWCKGPRAAQLLTFAAAFFRVAAAEIAKYGVVCKYVESVQLHVHKNPMGRPVAALDACLLLPA
jgi:hypothetical protein